VRACWFAETRNHPAPIRLRAPTACQPSQAGLDLVGIFLFVDSVRHGRPEIADEPPHDAVARGNAGALVAAVADIDLSAAGYWGLSATVVQRGTVEEGAKVVRLI